MYIRDALGAGGGERLVVAKTAFWCVLAPIFWPSLLPSNCAPWGASPPPPPHATSRYTYQVSIPFRRGVIERSFRRQGCLSLKKGRLWKSVCPEALKVALLNLRSL
jgi:hypothetical protein